ncbi:MAG: glycosyltransferase family 39 protein [Sandaracinus sp.]
MALWALATALNVAKPYHVDDAFYVAEARWIAAHPDRPTSGRIAWEGEHPEPFFRAGNHAPLVPALQASVIATVGESPIALHLLTSIFTALVVLFAHALARRHAPAHALAITALVVLSPALIAEQNVMLDVPLCAAWLAAWLALDRDDPRGIVGAGAAIAVGVLVKLSSIALLALLVWEGARALRARTIRASHLALACALPCASLALWGLASHAETGEVAFLSRAQSVLEPTLARGLLASMGVGAARAALFVIVLGGVMPAGLVLVPAWLVRAGHRGALRAGGAVLLGLVIVARTLVPELARRAGVSALADEPLAHSLLRVADLAIGAAVLTLVFARARHVDEIDRRLARWLAVGALAAIGLAPFLAARHALLVLVPAWLLVARAGLLDDARSTRIALALAGLVGLGAAVADHRMAQLYAEAAPRLREQVGAAPGTRVLTVGHWGWQEHAARAGLVAYEPGVTALHDGDVLVEPLGVHAQAVDLADRDRLERIDVVTVEAGPLDLVRTLVDREGLYVSWYGLPWSLRTEPLERFVVSRVRPR